MDVDHLFESVFYNNAFTNRLVEKSKITDIRIDDWQDADEHQKAIKVRHLEYKIQLSGALGTRTCKSRELRVKLRHRFSIQKLKFND